MYRGIDESSSGCRAFVAAVVVAGLVLVPHASFADEGGVSFWLPNQFASLAAGPSAPGWTFAASPYYASVGAGADVAKARDIQIGRFNSTVDLGLAASLEATARLIFISSSYVFESPVLGGQAAIRPAVPAGNADSSLAGTLTISVPSGSRTQPFYVSNSASGFGDL